MPITCLGLPTSTQIHHPPTASLSLQGHAVINFRSTAGWRQRSGENLCNIPLKTTEHIAQWVEKLTCIHEVTDLITGEQIFFQKLYFLPTCFLKLSIEPLLLGIPSMHQDGTWTKLHLETRLSWLLIDICFCCSLHRTGVERRQGTAVVHFLSKPHRQTVVNQRSCRFNPQWLTSAAVGSIPA